MVTICTTSLTFNNSTLCPHSVFMCLVWTSEQTAIISLYSINWLIFVTDLTLCSPVVTICTASLTFNNSTFSPHTVPTHTHTHTHTWIRFFSLNILSYISLYLGSFLLLFLVHQTIIVTKQAGYNQNILLQSTVPAPPTRTVHSAACCNLSLRKEWHSVGKEPGPLSVCGRRTSLYRAFLCCELSAFMSTAVSGCHLRAALHPNHAHMICILQWLCVLRRFVLSCETFWTQLADIAQ